MSIVPVAVRLDLPREEWDDHPLFPVQTLLLGGHESFRRTSQTLLHRAEAGGDNLGIHWVFQVWKGGMHSHEHYEEHKLYPYLTHVWGLSFDVARQGHEDLADVEAEVLARSRDAGAASPALAEALRRHDQVLVDHLALEEQLVIPALLALEPAAFETFLRSDIGTLLRRTPSRLDERSP